MRRGRNPRAVQSRQERFRKARHLWRALRTRFDTDLSRCRPLPLLIGRVQRGVVETWLAGTTPAIRTLRKVLEALGIDLAPYAEFLRERGGSVDCICPGCGRRRSSQRYLLNRAERRLGRRLTRSPDGLIEWTCARCGRGRRGRANLLLINRPGRIRGADKQPRRRGPKTPEWKDAIGRAHMLNASLAKPFYLCPLCDLASYGHEWHQRCWLTWRWYCRRGGVDPQNERPPRLRQRGPDPARRLKRNYGLLMERSFRAFDQNGEQWRPTREELLGVPAILAAKPALASRVKPVGRRGRLRRLRSPSSVNKAIQAFLRVAPGGWDQIFTKSESGRAARQQALPLPESLKSLIEVGKRDALIIRLYGFGMRPEYVARLTGAHFDHINHAVAKARYSEPRQVSSRSLPE
jgi:hypothetical protein